RLREEGTGVTKDQGRRVFRLVGTNDRQFAGKSRHERALSARATGEAPLRPGPFRPSGLPASRCAQKDAEPGSSLLEAENPVGKPPRRALATQLPGSSLGRAASYLAQRLMTEHRLTTPQVFHPLASTEANPSRMVLALATDRGALRWTRGRVVGSFGRA